METFLIKEFNFGADFEGNLGWLCFQTTAYTFVHKENPEKAQSDWPQNRWLRSFDKPQIMKVLMNLDGENRRLLLRVDKFAKIKL